MYADADTDGYGNVAVTGVHCHPPAGYVADSTDCDDTDPDTNPGADEYCDGVDNDCDGYTDASGMPISGAAGAIADDDTTTFIANVSGAGTIADLDVLPNITHTYEGDLDILLTSPEGTTVGLFADLGGSGDNFAQTVLNDDAPLSITEGTAPFTGLFRPEGMLADFEGENPNGTWTLQITDDGPGDIGSLDGWSLILHGTSPCD